jgi:hypothetical protein
MVQVFKNWVGSMGAPAAVYSHVSYLPVLLPFTSSTLRVEIRLQIVGDRIVSPTDHAHLFTERIVMHPLSFFAPAAYVPDFQALTAPLPLFEQFTRQCGMEEFQGEGLESLNQSFDFGELYLCKLVNFFLQ